MGLNTLAVYGECIALLPGRSDAPSRLIRAQKPIPGLLPLEQNIFRLAPEGMKIKSFKSVKRDDFQGLIRSVRSSGIAAHPVPDRRLPAPHETIFRAFLASIEPARAGLPLSIKIPYSPK